MEKASHQYEIVEKTIKFIQKNLVEQPTLDEISKNIFVSKFHLQRTFKEWAGVSPKEFLQYITLEQSKLHLRKGRTTLETAFNVGLSGNGRLHDLFLKHEACTPGEYKNKGKDLEIQWYIISSYFGNAVVGETKKGICKVSFLNNEEDALYELRKEYPKANFTEELGENGSLLKQYFEDWKVPKKKIELFLKGTPFQVQVWKALLQIPSAQLVSYQDISNKIGNSKAVRAVGTAIGKNPIAYLIPCHRVIKNNGSMGEYHWEKERKLIINGFEQAQLNN